MKVAYLMFNDEPWKPLIRRQVLELLSQIQQEGRDMSIILLVAYPWYWHLTHRLSLRRKVREFVPKTVKLRLLPLPFPAPVPHWRPVFHNDRGWRPNKTLNASSLPYLGYLLLPYLAKLHLLDGVRIFHGRSYPATAALQYFKDYFPKVRIVFDPRSDFPEENKSLNGIFDKSTDFNFWKLKERQLLQQSDATICISDYYQKHYKENGLSGGEIIGNNVDTSLFKFSEDRRKSLRRDLQLEDHLIFCYLGTMYPGTWHEPHFYAEFLKQLLKYEANYCLLFLVPVENSEFISERMTAEGIDPSCYRIIHPHYEEVPHYLSASDYGLFFLRHKKIALSVKLVEYNAVGLPVLVNENAISAAQFVRRYHTGKVLNLGLGDWDTRVSEWREGDLSALLKVFCRQDIAAIARAKFSNERVASHYLKLYRKLVAG